MEKPMTCTCRMAFKMGPPRREIAMCPMHAKAPEMLDTLQALLNALPQGQTWPLYMSDVIVRARAILNDLED